MASCSAIFFMKSLLNADAMYCGNWRIEMAKMIGMTPPVFTRSGRYVFCPP